MIKLIVKPAAAFLLAGIFPSLALSQNPIPAPTHVFIPAVGQSFGRDIRNSSVNTNLVRQNSAVAPSPAIHVPLSITSGTITFVCDPNIDAAVAGTCNFLNTTVAGFYASAFTNANARIYIQYGNTGLGSSTTGFLNLVSYAAYRAALAATASGSAHDTASLASLPGSEPGIYSGGQIEVTSALGTALGLSGMIGTTAGGSSCNTPGSGTCYNGIITLATPAIVAGYGQGYYYRGLPGTGSLGALDYDIFSVVEHELDEVLGSSSCIDTTGASLADGCNSTNASAVDLFRYSGAGTRVFISTTPGAYFSYNGGTTNVAVYNTLSNGNDYADFATNCEHVQDATGCLGQSFDISSNGAAEIAILDAVGYNVQPPTAPPTISKAFNPASIPLSGTSILTVTIGNTNAAPLSGIGFTDNLPAGIVVAATPSLNNTCNGTVTGATASSTSVSLSGGTLAGDATCTVSIHVTANTAGVKVNTTTAVTSAEAGNGGTASATLTVVAPPSISKAFNPIAIQVLGTSILTASITNPNTTTITGVAFTDNLPSGVVVAGTPALSNSCGGTVTGATANSTSVSLLNGILAGGATCTVSVTVTGNTSGIKNNTTTAVTSTESGSGNSASATLSVFLPPSISKAFQSNKILPGGTTALNFTITNPNSFGPLPGVGFTDTFPSGLVIATPNGLTGSCGGGTITGTAGSGSVSLVNATLAASASCTFSLNVTAPEGIYNNTTGAVFSTYGAGNTASDTLFAATPPSLGKNFGEVSIGVNNTVSLTLTLANPNHIVTLHGLQFSDTLPTGLVVATPNGLTGSCGGGTITAVAGSNLITLGSAALAPQTGCTFSVNVTANGAALALLTNTTSTVTSNEALPGVPASANIFVGDPFQITYASNLAVGDSFVNITNTGASGASLPSGTTASIAGAICANIYAFTPDEQLVSCCSCPVTPNGLVSLSAKNNLASNTLTPAVPTALVIKVLATLPVAGSCTNSAASVGGASLANGVKSFGTTIHATPDPATYGVTERPFSPATLSAGELSRIGSLCNFILANGSGFGVCQSCRLSGLGSERQ